MTDRDLSEQVAGGLVGKLVGAKAVARSAVGEAPREKEKAIIAREEARRLRAGAGAAKKTRRSGGPV